MKTPKCYLFFSGFDNSRKAECSRGIQFSGYRKDSRKFNLHQAIPVFQACLHLPPFSTIFYKLFNSCDHGYLQQRCDLWSDPFRAAVATCHPAKDHIILSGFLYTFGNGIRRGISICATKGSITFRFSLYLWQWYTPWHKHLRRQRIDRKAGIHRQRPRPDILLQHYLPQKVPC